jgi:hypothetical protein
MALCRCENHQPRNNRKHDYLYKGYPIGYPATSSICGRVECNKPGLAFLTQSEFDEFQGTQRIFKYGSHTSKVKLDDKLPIRYKRN